MLIVNARKVGWCQIKRRPSPISRQTPVCVSSGLGTGSGLPIKPRHKAESRKEMASKPIAIGALSVCTNQPPSVGPAISAAELLTASLLLASTSWARGTKEGR